jgi:hypothetical protein
VVHGALVWAPQRLHLLDMGAAVRLVLSSRGCCWAWALIRVRNAHWQQGTLLALGHLWAHSPRWVHQLCDVAVGLWLWACSSC